MKENENIIGILKYENELVLYYCIYDYSDSLGISKITSDEFMELKEANIMDYTNASMELDYDLVITVNKNFNASVNRVIYTNDKYYIVETSFDKITCLGPWMYKKDIVDRNLKYINEI